MPRPKRKQRENTPTKTPTASPSLKPRGKIKCPETTESSLLLTPPPTPLRTPTASPRSRRKSHTLLLNPTKRKGKKRTLSRVVVNTTNNNCKKAITFSDHNGWIESLKPLSTDISNLISPPATPLSSPSTPSADSCNPHCHPLEENFLDEIKEDSLKKPENVEEAVRDEIVSDVSLPPSPKNVDVSDDVEVLAVIPRILKKITPAEPVKRKRGCSKEKVENEPQTSSDLYTIEKVKLRQSPEYHRSLLKDIPISQPSQSLNGNTVGGPSLVKNKADRKYLHKENGVIKTVFKVKTVRQYKKRDKTLSDLYGSQLLGKEKTIKKSRTSKQKNKTVSENFQKEETESPSLCKEKDVSQSVCKEKAIRKPRTPKQKNKTASESLQKEATESPSLCEAKDVSQSIGKEKTVRKSRTSKQKNKTVSAECNNSSLNEEKSNRQSPEYHKSLLKISESLQREETKSPSLCKEKDARQSVCKEKTVRKLRTPKQKNKTVSEHLQREETESPTLCKEKDVSLSLGKEKAPRKPRTPKEKNKTVCESLQREEAESPSLDEEKDVNQSLGKEKAVRKPRTPKQKNKSASESLQREETESASLCKEEDVSQSLGKEKAPRTSQKKSKTVSEPLQREETEISSVCKEKDVSQLLCKEKVVRKSRTSKQKDLQIEETESPSLCKEKDVSQSLWKEKAVRKPRTPKQKSNTVSQSLLREETENQSLFKEKDVSQSLCKEKAPRIPRTPKQKDKTVSEPLQIEETVSPSLCIEKDVIQLLRKEKAVRKPRTPKQKNITVSESLQREETETPLLHKEKDVSQLVCKVKAVRKSKKDKTAIVDSQREENLCEEKDVGQLLCIISESLQREETESPSFCKEKDVSQSLCKEKAARKSKQKDKTAIVDSASLSLQEDLGEDSKKKTLKHKPCEFTFAPISNVELDTPEIASTEVELRRKSTSRLAKKEVNYSEEERPVTPKVFTVSKTCSHNIPDITEDSVPSFPAKRPRGRPPANKLTLESGLSFTLSLVDPDISTHITVPSISKTKGKNNPKQPKTQSQVGSNPTTSQGTSTLIIQEPSSSLLFKDSFIIQSQEPKTPKRKYNKAVKPLKTSPISPNQEPNPLIIQEPSSSLLFKDTFIIQSPESILSTGQTPKAPKRKYNKAAKPLKASPISPNQEPTPFIQDPSSSLLFKDTFIIQSQEPIPSTAQNYSPKAPKRKYNKAAKPLKASPISPITEPTPLIIQEPSSSKSQEPSPSEGQKKLPQARRGFNYKSSPIFPNQEPTPSTSKVQPPSPSKSSLKEPSPSSSSESFPSTSKVAYSSTTQDPHRPSRNIQQPARFLDFLDTSNQPFSSLLSFDITKPSQEQHRPSRNIQQPARYLDSLDTATKDSIAVMRLHQMKRGKSLAYDLNNLSWNKDHTVNQQGVYCYCGESGSWYSKMVQCSRCCQWFHERCLAPRPMAMPIIFGDLFYLFVCSSCNHGSECLKRMDMSWTDLVHLALFDLTYKTCRTFHDLEKDLVPDVLANWSLFGKPKNLLSELENMDMIRGVLEENKDRFRNGVEAEQSETLWGLQLLSPPPRPNYKVPELGIISERTVLDEVVVDQPKYDPNGENVMPAQLMVVQYDQYVIPAPKKKKARKRSSNKINGSVLLDKNKSDLENKITKKRLKLDSSHQISVNPGMEANAFQIQVNFLKKKHKTSGKSTFRLDKINLKVQRLKKTREKKIGKGQESTQDPSITNGDLENISLKVKKCKKPREKKSKKEQENLPAPTIENGDIEKINLNVQQFKKPRVPKKIKDSEKAKGSPIKKENGDIEKINLRVQFKKPRVPKKIKDQEKVKDSHLNKNVKEKAQKFKKPKAKKINKEQEIVPIPATSNDVQDPTANGRTTRSLAKAVEDQPKPSEQIRTELNQRLHKELGIRVAMKFAETVPKRPEEVQALLEAPPPGPKNKRKQYNEYKKAPMILPDKSTNASLMDSLIPVPPNFNESNNPFKNNLRRLTEQDLNKKKKKQKDKKPEELQQLDVTRIKGRVLGTDGKLRYLIAVPWQSC